MATTINRLITFAEFEQMPDAPDGRYELRHGELVKVPPPKLPHARIQHRLRRLLESAAGDAAKSSPNGVFGLCPKTNIGSEM